MNQQTSSDLGKPGTISKEEFTALNSAAQKFSVRLLASKVAKICGRKSASLKHEYPASTVAAAYDGIVNKIVTAVGKQDTAIPTPLFDQLTGMVAQYGPEVVIWKLAKIAKSSNNASDSALLSGLFPNGVKAAAKAATSTARSSRRFL
jgi:hypothetical protein